MQAVFDQILTGIGYARLDVLTAIMGVITLCIIVVALWWVVTVVMGSDYYQDEGKEDDI